MYLSLSNNKSCPCGMRLTIFNSLSSPQSPLSHYTSVCVSHACDGHSERRQAGRQALVCDSLPSVFCCSEGCGLAGGPTDLTNNSYDKPVTRLSEALTDDTRSRLSPWACDITRLLVEVVMGMFSSCCTLICIQMIALIAQSVRHDTIYWHSNEHERSSTKRMQNTRAAYQHVTFF